MNKLLKIASYKRHIDSNHERMFENVLDWEHLPHLHSRTFSSINLLAKGEKSLKFEVGLWPAIFGLRQTIRLQACKLRGTWIVRVLSGFMQGLLIRSCVSPESSEGFQVRVDFYIPRSKWYLAPLGPIIKLSYHRLYDEDVAMMTSRQIYLESRSTGPKIFSENSLNLGKEKDMQCPHSFTFQDKPYLLGKIDDNWIAYSAYCPHLQRPFNDLKINNGKIRCPWHGYEFDLKTGSSIQSRCRMPLAPNITRDGKNLFAVAHVPRS